MPRLFFNFRCDTGFTFGRRLLAGEDVTQAHRAHLYQLFNRLGYSHTTVSLFHLAVAIAQGVGERWLVGPGAEHRAYVCLPVLAFQRVDLATILLAAPRGGPA